MRGTRKSLFWAYFLCVIAALFVVFLPMRLVSEENSILDYYSIFVRRVTFYFISI